MKKAFNYIVFLSAFVLAVAFQGCSEDVLDQPGMTGEGTLLNLYVGDINGPSTRLAELGGSGDINDDHHGKKHIGLYIYYADDYNANDVTTPYVRNLECKIDNGKIVPVDGSDIYIYDRMTIVAFYPYNGDTDDYTFTSKNDEKRYSITESDYSQQHFIPYRAQANVNPTNAFYVNLTLHPVQTTKIQVVLVASNPDDFPDATTQTNGVVKLVPGIDPQNTVEGATGDRRENWIDIVEQPYGSAPEPPSSGLHVQRYSTYIWRNDGENDPQHGGQSNHHDNTIKKGEILLQSDNLTLFFPEDVNIQESRVYRYGYNIDTGEIFIPTSEILIHDAASLAAAGGGGYQVCDIDLKDVPNWDPVNLIGTYDGGGHAIKNMKIEQKLTESANIGLFGSVTGSALIKNLELIDPVINVDFSDALETETLQVGALVGQLNRALTEDEIAAIIASQSINVPDGLPQSVIDALIAEMMQDYTGGNTSSIEGTKVSNPQITVTGNNVVVGGLVGSVGDGAEYIGEIKDSYVSGGDILVNATDETKTIYDNAQAGAFAGLLNSGGITNSYTTATAEAFVKEVTGTPPNEVTGSKEVAKGFTNVEVHDPALGIDQELTGNFTVDLKGQTESGITKFDSEWPNWTLHTDDWPVAASTLGNYWGDLGEVPSTYPVLKWENRFDVKK